MDSDPSNSEDLEPNPYQAPLSESPIRQERKQARTVLTIVLLSILMVPASVVCGVVACAGTFILVGESGFGLGLLMGGLTTVSILGLLVYLIWKSGWKNRNRPK